MDDLRESLILYRARDLPQVDEGATHVVATSVPGLKFETTKENGGYTIRVLHAKSNKLLWTTNVDRIPKEKLDASIKALARIWSESGVNWDVDEDELSSTKDLGSVVSGIQAAVARKKKPIKHNDPNEPILGKLVYFESKEPTMDRNEVFRQMDEARVGKPRVAKGFQAFIEAKNVCVDCGKPSDRTSTAQVPTNRCSKCLNIRTQKTYDKVRNEEGTDDSFGKVTDLKAEGVNLEATQKEAAHRAQARGHQMGISAHLRGASKAADDKDIDWKRLNKSPGKSTFSKSYYNGLKKAQIARGDFDKAGWSDKDKKRLGDQAKKAHGDYKRDVAGKFESILKDTECKSCGWKGDVSSDNKWGLMNVKCPKCGKEDLYGQGSKSLKGESYAKPAKIAEPPAMDSDDLHTADGVDKHPETPDKDGQEADPLYKQGANESEGKPYVYGTPGSDEQSLKDLEMHTASPRFKNALHALKRKIDTLTPEQQKKVKAAAQRIYGEAEGIIKRDPDGKFGSGPNAGMPKPKGRGQASGATGNKSRLFKQIDKIGKQQGLPEGDKPMPPEDYDDAFGAKGDYTVHGDEEHDPKKESAHGGNVKKTDQGYQVYVNGPKGEIPQGQPHKDQAAADKDLKDFDESGLSPSEYYSQKGKTHPSEKGKKSDPSAIAAPHIKKQLQKRKKKDVSAEVDKKYPFLQPHHRKDAIKKKMSESTYQQKQNAYLYEAMGVQQIDEDGTVRRGPKRDRIIAAATEIVVYSLESGFKGEDVERTQVDRVRRMMGDAGFRSRLVKAAAGYSLKVHSNLWYDFQSSAS